MKRSRWKEWTKNQRRRRWRWKRRRRKNNNENNRKQLNNQCEANDTAIKSFQAQAFLAVFFLFSYLNELYIIWFSQQISVGVDVDEWLVLFLSYHVHQWWSRIRLVCGFENQNEFKYTRKMRKKNFAGYSSKEEIESEIEFVLFSFDFDRFGVIQINLIVALISNQCVDILFRPSAIFLLSFISL